MKKVEAFIRHEAFEPIRQELLERGIPSLSISEVKGSGRQKGVVEHYRGASLTVNVRPKLKIACVVDDLASRVVRESFDRRESGGHPARPSIRRDAGKRGDALRAECREHANRAGGELGTQLLHFADAHL